MLIQMEMAIGKLGRILIQMEMAIAVIMVS